MDRKVITAAVIGSLLCGTLLVVALGIITKLHASRTMPGRHRNRYISPIGRIQQEIFARQSAPPLYDEAMRTSRPYEEMLSTLLEQMREAEQQQQEDDDEALIDVSSMPMRRPQPDGSSLQPEGEEACSATAGGVEPKPEGCATAAGVSPGLDDDIPLDATAANCDIHIIDEGRSASIAAELITEMDQGTPESAASTVTELGAPESTPTSETEQGAPQGSLRGEIGREAPESSLGIETEQGVAESGLGMNNAAYEDDDLLCDGPLEQDTALLMP